MCGLVAAISDSFLSSADMEVAKVISALSVLRGSDSSGFHITFRKQSTFVNKPENFTSNYAKSLMTLPELVYGRHKHAQLLDVPKGFTTKFFIAHARAATLGSVTKENAHPHVYKHIVGVHNGTVPYFTPSFKKDGDVSDSVLMFESLADHGIEKTFRNIGSGAAAIIYHDKKQCTLNIIRNGLRPLYKMRLGDVDYFASEEWMLRVAARRTERTADFSTVEVTEVPKNILHIYSLGPFGHTTVDLNPPPFVPTNPPPNLLKKDNKPAVYTTAEKSATSFTDYNSKQVDLSLIKLKLARGCTWCNIKATISDVIYWKGRDEYLCTDCHGNFRINDIFPDKGKYVRGEHVASPPALFGLTRGIPSFVNEDHGSES